MAGPKNRTEKMPRDTDQTLAARAPRERRIFTRRHRITAIESAATCLPGDVPADRQREPGLRSRRARRVLRAQGVADAAQARAAFGWVGTGLTTILTECPRRRRASPHRVRCRWRDLAPWSVLPLLTNAGRRYLHPHRSHRRKKNGEKPAGDRDFAGRIAGARAHSSTQTGSARRRLAGDDWTGPRPNFWTASSLDPARLKITQFSALHRLLAS